MSSSKPTGNKTTVPPPSRRRPAPSTQPVIPPYNPLLDKNLRQFFSSEGVQRQLYNIGLIDSDGRILNVGSSSGKLNVVDKELKRIEQQEEDLAKEEANLRARVRELRLQRFEQEQQLRRLAIIKEEERIRHEIVRLQRESNHGTITNAPLAANSIIHNNLNPSSNSYYGGVVPSSSSPSSSSPSSSLYPLPLASSINTNTATSNHNNNNNMDGSVLHVPIQSSLSSSSLTENDYVPSSSSASPGYASSVVSSSSPSPHKLPLSNSDNSNTTNYLTSSSSPLSSSVPSSGTFLPETSIPTLNETGSTHISSDLLELLRNRSEETGVKLPTTPAMHAKRIPGTRESAPNGNIMEEETVSKEEDGSNHHADHSNTEEEKKE